MSYQLAQTNHIVHVSNDRISSKMAIQCFMCLVLYSHSRGHEKRLWHSHNVDKLWQESNGRSQYKQSIESEGGKELKVLSNKLYCYWKCRPGEGEKREGEREGGREGEREGGGEVIQTFKSTQPTRSVNRLERRGTRL